MIRNKGKRICHSRLVVGLFLLLQRRYVLHLACSRQLGSFFFFFEILVMNDNRMMCLSRKDKKIISFAESIMDPLWTMDSSTCRFEEPFLREFKK